jgi:hypothetical protein
VVSMHHSTRRNRTSLGKVDGSLSRVLVGVLFILLAIGDPTPFDSSVICLQPATPKGTITSDDAATENERRGTLGVSTRGLSRLKDTARQPHPLFGLARYERARPSLGLPFPGVNGSRTQPNQNGLGIPLLC